MTPFKGQTENAGHFLQPTAKAIGHNVMSLLPFVCVRCGETGARSRVVSVEAGADPRIPALTTEFSRMQSIPWRRWTFYQLSNTAAVRRPRDSSKSGAGWKSRLWANRDSLIAWMSAAR
jgi:hypothetical protein